MKIKQQQFQKVETMKKGDKVMTWVHTEPGVICKVNPDGTVDVKFKGYKGVSTLPPSMCKKYDVYENNNQLK